MLNKLGNSISWENMVRKILVLEKDISRINFKRLEKVYINT